MSKKEQIDNEVKAPSFKELAEELRLVTIERKKAEERERELKKLLLPLMEEKGLEIHYFKSAKMKLSISAGRSTSKINTRKLFGEMKKLKRLKEFVQLATIKEKDLSLLPEGKIFIAKYKEVIPSEKKSITIGKMTKKEMEM